MTPDDPPAGQPLPRVIGVFGVAFASFNGMVGAGIFGLPALVAALLGPAAVLAYLVCATLVALVGLCLAEAGSRVSGPGGLYAYSRAAFGPVVGGVAGMLLLVANTVASGAALARFLMDAIAAVWPATGGVLAQTALLAVIYLVVALLSIRSTGLAARLSTLLGLAKLAPLVVLILASLFVLHPANLRWTGLPALGAVGQAAVLLFFAFVGIETGLATSGEVIAPSRTIPRALLLAATLVAALYVGLQLSAQGVLGAALPTAKAPLIAMASRICGPFGTAVLLTTTILSGFGYLVADLLASPRYSFALAEAGQLPRWFAKVSPRYGTPVVAISAYAFVCFVMAATGTFLQLVVLSSSGTLALYFICCLGVLRLRAKGVGSGAAPFRAPGGAATPILAAAIVVWLLSTLAPKELAAGGVLIAGSALAYGLIEWRRRGRVRA